MKIGYARVSTTDQHLEIQLRELEKAGCEKLYKEKISGTHLKRPELLRMLEDQFGKTNGSKKGSEVWPAIKIRPQPNRFN